MRYEIFDVDGNVENVIAADEGFILMNYPDRHRLVETPDQFPIESTVIKQAFVNRFTAEEWAAVDNATDLESYKCRMKFARIIDVKSQWVFEFLDTLIAKGTLTEERKIIIINTPVDPNTEKP